MSRRRLVVMAAVVLATACGDRDGPAVETGAHAGLDCAACHAGPATGEVVAAVSADSCAACHTTGLAETVQVANVSLTHAHPGPDGIARAGCATCHTHAEGAAPLTVNTTGCFLCHADPAPAGAPPPAMASLPADRCAECHVQPTHLGFAQTGAPVDHATVLQRGISCVLCHYDVVEGSGTVEPARCRACHGRLGGPAALASTAPPEDAGALHAAHLAGDVRLACARCHVPVDHRVVKLASALVLDCADCHAPGDAALRLPLDSAAHRPAQQLYAGLAPAHPGVLPALKFVERVSCDACHGVASTQASGRAAIRAINATCVGCHGERFDSLLESWLTGMAEHSAAVSAYVTAATATLPAGGAADSLGRLAAEAVRLVDAGRGVNNLPGADSLLRAALGSASLAYRRAGLALPPPPDIGPAPARESCVRCHYGIDTDPEASSAAPFEHGRHLLTAALPCAECHGTADFFQEDGRTFDAAHGSITVTAMECAVCHHVDTTLECAACHTAAEISALDVPHDVTVNVVRHDVRTTRRVLFDHAAHSDIACAQCHSSATPRRPAVACADCHADHHRAVASPAGCASCHGADVRAHHERVDHLSCGACHATATLELLGSADRAFCVQCHTDQLDHEPGGQCAQCHLQLSPDEAMRAILSATAPPRRVFR